MGRAGFLAAGHVVSGMGAARAVPGIGIVTEISSSGNGIGARWSFGHGTEELAMGLPVNCTQDEFAVFARDVGQETQRVLADIHDCLSERGEQVLASFLRDHASTASDLPPEEPALGRARYRLVFAIPDSRRLLEVALGAKSRAWALFEDAARDARDPEVRALAAAISRVEAMDVRRLAQALGSIAPAAGWEALLEQGNTPSLALGAERRLRRAPRERAGGQNPPVT
jgi:hypothetical protein